MPFFLNRSVYLKYGAIVALSATSLGCNTRPWGQPPYGQNPYGQQVPAPNWAAPGTPPAGSTNLPSVPNLPPPNAGSTTRTPFPNMQRPQWGQPGTINQQQQRASAYDPYADNDAGPEIVGGRPREFQKPMAEPVRARGFRDTRWPF